MSHSRLISTLIAGMFLLTLTGPMLAHAREPAGSPVKRVHDPVSGSYFELRSRYKSVRHWDQAHKAAAGMVYKGRRGRLAVVKDERTLNFIQQNFTLNIPTWIGMRFFCKFRKLVWVTGEIQPLKSPGMWAPRWHRTDIKCSNNNISYMPVYLTSEDTGGVAWQASGPGKYFPNFLVEYPAPPAKDKKADASQH